MMHEIKPKPAPTPASKQPERTLLNAPSTVTPLPGGAIVEWDLAAPASLTEAETRAVLASRFRVATALKVKALIGVPTKKIAWETGLSESTVRHIHAILCKCAKTQHK